MKLLIKLVSVYLILCTVMINAVSPTYKYTPVIMGDGINIMIPYAVIPPPVVVNTYIPPANSLGFTTITTTDGKKIRVDRTPNGFVFEGYVGKIVLLEIYGYTCPHCIASIPGYNSIQAKYPNDVYIITLEAYGLSNSGLQQYVIDHNIQYDTVAKENIGDMFSFVNSLTGWSPGIGVPWLMIFSRDGIQEGQSMLGDIDVPAVETIINGLL